MTAKKIAFWSLTILVILGSAGAGCQRTQSPQTNATPIAPASSQENTQPVAEASRDRPSLSGEIESMSLYSVPNKSEDLAISLVVSIRNSGAPSVAGDWKLAVNSPITSVTVEPVHVNGVVEMPGTKSARVDLAKEDLAIKSKQSSIAKGGQLSGILTFVLPKTSAAQLSNNGSSLILHFKDGQDNFYRTRKAVIGGKLRS